MKKFRFFLFLVVSIFLCNYATAEMRFDLSMLENILKSGIGSQDSALVMLESARQNGYDYVRIYKDNDAEQIAIEVAKNGFASNYEDMVQNETEGNVELLKAIKEEFLFQSRLLSEYLQREQKTTEIVNFSFALIDDRQVYKEDEAIRRILMCTTMTDGNTIAFDFGLISEQGEWTELAGTTVLITGGVEQSSEQEILEPQSYVLNTNTFRFHRPSCSSVNRMKEKNKREMIVLREELIKQGYSPCGDCNP